MKKYKEELAVLEGHLSRTQWGKVYARDAQIRAGARKMFDMMLAEGKRLARKKYAA